MKNFIKEIRWYLAVTILTILLIPNNRSEEPFDPGHRYCPANKILAQLEKIEEAVQLHTGLDEEEKQMIAAIKIQRTQRHSVPIITAASKISGYDRIR